MNEPEFALVDADLYVPLKRSQEGTRYAPAAPPPGWKGREGACT
jgi:hypothetical protein